MGALVAQLFGRVLREVGDVARGDVHQLDLVARAGLRLGGVGDRAAVGRPCRIDFGGLRRGRQVHYIAGLGRDHEDVPLLVAIVIGGVGDPGAVGRPHRLRLPLVADGELHRPTAGRRDEPEIVAAADVGDERDLFAVGRPGRAADQARHVELLDGEGRHVGDGLALKLGGVGDGLRGGERLLRECGQSHKKDECEGEEFQVSGFQFRINGAHSHLL